MSAYMDLSAAELADCLELTARFPGNTGVLSMLDEATLEYGWRYDSIGPAQKAFADARHAHMSSYTTERGDYAPEAWDKAMAAARDLAAALRPLGDFTLPRCKRKGPCGTCNIALDDDGQCRSTLGHVDEADVTAVLDEIPGAREHVMQSLERARAGEAISLDELPVIFDVQITSPRDEAEVLLDMDGRREHLEQVAADLQDGKIRPVDNATARDRIEKRS